MNLSTHHCYFLDAKDTPTAELSEAGSVGLTVQGEHFLFISFDVSHLPALATLVGLLAQKVSGAKLRALTVTDDTRLAEADRIDTNLADAAASDTHEQEF